MSEETTVQSQPETDATAVVDTPETSATTVDTPEADSGATLETTGDTSTLAERIEGIAEDKAALYEKRYPTLWKLAHDSSQPDDVRAILLDKINADEDVKKYMAASKVEESPFDEPIFEDETKTTETPTTQVETAPVDAEKRYYSDLETIVSQNMRPEAINRLGEGLLKILGADTSALNDPKATPEQKAQAWQIKQAAPELGKFLAVGLADGLKALLPAYLPKTLEDVAPGFTETTSARIWQSTWGAIRSFKSSKDGKSPYSSLPAFDTQEFQDKALKAVKSLGSTPTEFDEMTWPGMTSKQIAQRKMMILAKAMTGQRVDPIVVANAIDKGKQSQIEADRRARAGKVLGAGQSKKDMGESTATDPTKTGLAAYIQKQNAGRGLPK